ncbi:MAG: hypothetical protein ABR549_14765 [Mycobacteriales bacterium]
MRAIPLVTAALLALPLLGGSSATASPDLVPEGVVYGGSAAGALIGVTLRIPAVSAGGIGYADSQVDLSAARARSSSAYPGFLVDAFMKSSCGCAYNPSDTIAQNPPSSSAPTKSAFQGSQSTPAGEQATIAAEAPSVVEASSRYISGGVSAPAAPITIKSGTVVSSTLVQPDGTVVSDVTTTASGVEIAGVVSISQATSRAKTVTAPGKQPVMTVTSKVGSVLVSGIRSELSDAGLVVADQSAVTPQQLAVFNGGVPALADQGVYISALEPVVQTVRPGFGEVLTGAFRVRYQVKDNPTPNDIGTDVEYVVASVRNLASSQNRIRPQRSDHAAPLRLPPAPVGAQTTPSTHGGSPLGTGSAVVPAAGFSPVTGPVVAPPAAVAGGKTLADLLANSKKAGAAPKVIGLYGWLVAFALIFTIVPARVLGRRQTA